MSAPPQSSPSLLNQLSAVHATDVDHDIDAPVVQLPERPVDAEAVQAPRRGGATRDDKLRRRLMVGDLFAVTLAAVAQASAAGFSEQLPMLLLALPLWLIVAMVKDIYRPSAWRWDHAAAEEFASIVAVTAQWGAACLVLGWFAGLLSFVKIGPLAAGWIITIASVLAVRSLVRWRARRRSWYWENAIVLGSAEQAERVVKRILRHRRFGINVMACVEPSTPALRAALAGADADARPRKHIGSVPVVPDAPELLELVEALELDRVIIAGPLDNDRQRELIGYLADADVHIDLVPDWGELVSARLEVRHLAGVPLLTAPSASVDPGSLRIKRAFDVVVSAVALVLLSPVLIACAVAIKIDSRGPVFFRQRRVGKDERRFNVLKFRSMYADADARKADVAELNFHGGGNENGMFKIRRDPRITRVGRFLRRSSLDELPQLSNVLRGEMSLVGPRPLIESEHQQISGRFRRRTALTPGITGLWQVNGRSDVPFEEMISLDLLYAATWSLRRDAKLLMRTFSAVMRADGAY